MLFIKALCSEYHLYSAAYKEFLRKGLFISSEWNNISVDIMYSRYIDIYMQYHVACYNALYKLPRILKIIFDMTYCQQKHGTIA